VGVVVIAAHALVLARDALVPVRVVEGN